MAALFPAIFLVIAFFVMSPANAKPYGAKICEESGYTCYTAKRGDTWTKLYPDPKERDVMMRINRVNIRLYPGMKIAIPNQSSSDLMDFAPFEKQIDPPGKKIIKVSLTKLAFGAYNEDGTLAHWGPVSGGKGYCPDTGRRCRTATGNFAIYQKGGGGCASTRYPIGRGGAPMPFCMFFHGNFALHGSPEVPGYNASHGCVRMSVDDARWLNREFTLGVPSVPVMVSQ